MCKKILIMVMALDAVIVGVSGYGSCVASENYVVLEDAEDGQITGWEVVYYDGNSNVISPEAGVVNIYDEAKNSRVIKLDILSYPVDCIRFNMKNIDGNHYINENGDYIFRWDMKTSAAYTVEVAVNTNYGFAVMYYAPLNGNPWHGTKTPLSSDTTDGNWHTIRRDLSKDILNGYPPEIVQDTPDFKILSVNSIRFHFHGEARLDNIMLSGEETPWKSNENGILVTNAYFQNGVTLGYNFTLQKNGVITRLGGYFNGTTRVYLWDADKKLIVSAEVTSNNNWGYVDISPTQVTVGQRYTIAAYLGPLVGVSYRSDIETLPQKYKDITIENSCYDIGKVLPPNHIRTDAMSGQVDIGFIPNEEPVKDTTPPRGTVKINNDDKYTNSNLVSFNIYASDTGGSGIDNKIEFSNDNKTWLTPQESTAISPWRLPTVGSGDVDSSGKIIAADALLAAKYAAGKIPSQQPDELVRADVDGDGKITGNITGGDAKNILALSVGKKRDQLKGLNGLPLPTIRMDGEYKVYVKFYDKAGNYSVASDTIILDVTKPKITHTPITSARNSLPITFAATVTDTCRSMGSANVVLLYWCKSKTSTTWGNYQTVSLMYRGNNTYKETITSTGSQNIKYYIEDSDTTGNKAKTAEYIINRQ